MLGNKCGQPVLVVKYEDLKKDRTAEVYTYTMYVYVYCSTRDIITCTCMSEYIHVHNML